MSRLTKARNLKRSAFEPAAVRLEMGEISLAVCR
jgi:hypothetical protein